MHNHFRGGAGGRRWMFTIVSSALLAAVWPLACSTAAAQPSAGHVVHPDARLLFNGWGVTPVGKHTPISDMPLKMVVSKDGKTIAALSAGYNRTGLSLLDIASRRVNQFVPIPRCFNGIAFSADGKSLYVTGSNSGKLYAYPFADGRVGDAREATPAVGPGDGTGAHFLAGAAVAPTTGRVYVCDEGANSVLEINPADLSVVHRIPTGAHPHTCVFGADPRYLYVSNWGGRSVGVIDTSTAARVRDIDVGIRPNDMALGPDGRLFVACSGDNTVHVLQTRTVETPEPGASPTRRPPEGVREIISTSLYPASPEGSTPDAVAVSPDGKTLYVANADNNDVMVTDISDPSEARPVGFLPVGWYPTALAVSPDGGTLFTAEGKGLRSMANFPDPIAKGRGGGRSPRFAYIANLFQGYVSFIDRPTAEQMAKGTEQVRRNSPYTPATLRESAGQGESIIPARVGAPCPIKYVLYIIKENRTYDQVFGDLKDAAGHAVGNGDPALVMYGEGVTPNHHQLARDYVVLDNLYCNGEVSVDGHSWCDAAIATDAKQRSWILSYSGHGELPSNREMQDPEAGYLWDQCRRSGVTFKCYGEGASQVPVTNRGTWSGGRDMNRVDGWIKDLHTAEATGDLPQFMIMSLGEDHTSGTTPGRPTPDASVASNDIGLGKIVEAATHSKFWSQMAIFVVEDDSQNGPDHADAHRTAALVISPYVRQGTVDSTMYTQASLVRTMELILGLPPLTQFDASATPLFNTFDSKPVLVAYNRLTPAVDVLALNPAKGPDAKLSMLMDFSDYDRAPEDELNQVLWRAAKGPDVPYPAPHRHALLADGSTR